MAFSYVIFPIVVAELFLANSTAYGVIFTEVAITRFTNMICIGFTVSKFTLHLLLRLFGVIKSVILLIIVKGIALV